MQQITDFFKGLLESNLWPPRWYCGKWSDFHGWLYIISDIMIWAAYFMIPIIILRYFTKKKTDLPFYKAYILFAAFILLCGTTHFIDAVMFWVPVYRLNAVVRFITGVVSLLTVYHLIKLLPVAFKQKTNLELEREIKKREEAERKLAEANEGLEAFAYVASHDLKEPLRMVNSFMQKFQKDYAPQLDDRAKKYIHFAVDGSQRMTALIDELLVYAKTGNDDAAKELTNINVIIEEILHLQNGVLAEKGATVSYEPMPEIMVFKTGVKILFQNLISNAIKYMPANVKPIVKISVTEKTNSWEFAVADNGIGITPAAHKDIFKSFRRLHTNKTYAGTGMGLATCEKIVNGHGGNIWVNSEEGKGSTFYFTLLKI